MKLRAVNLMLLWRLSAVASFSPRSSSPSSNGVFYSTTQLLAKPKRGAIVDTYRTVSVNCNNCRQRLFRYKKKNGTKSNLIKCYVERIAEDSAGVLEQHAPVGTTKELDYSSIVQDLPMGHGFECPACGTQFARSAQIHGLPALKLVGGKVSMTKK